MRYDCSMMTFHESYGELPKSTLALYKNSNVSPADHDMLVDYYGENWYNIERAVRLHRSVQGSFIAFSWMQSVYGG